MLVSDAEIEAVSLPLGLTGKIASCICAIETGFNPVLVRYERDWKFFVDPLSWAKKLGITYSTEVVLQSFSWGPMQVMGSVAREHGYDGMLTELIHPSLGVKYGSLHMVKKFGRYGFTLDAISAYNAGSPQRVSTPGMRYGNQHYVDRFLTEWRIRGGSLRGEIELVP